MKTKILFLVLMLALQIGTARAEDDEEEITVGEGLCRSRLSEVTGGDEKYADDVSHFCRDKDIVSNSYMQTCIKVLGTMIKDTPTRNPANPDVANQSLHESVALCRVNEQTLYNPKSFAVCVNKLSHVNGIWLGRDPDTKASDYLVFGRSVKSVCGMIRDPGGVADDTASCMDKLNKKGFNFLQESIETIRNCSGAGGLARDPDAYMKCISIANDAGADSKSSADICANCGKGLSESFFSAAAKCYVELDKRKDIKFKWGEDIKNLNTKANLCTFAFPKSQPEKFIECYQETGSAGACLGLEYAQFHPREFSKCVKRVGGQYVSQSSLPPYSSEFWVGCGKDLECVARKKCNDDYVAKRTGPAPAPTPVGILIDIEPKAVPKKAPK